MVNLQVLLHTLCGGVAQLVQAACTHCAAPPAQSEPTTSMRVKPRQKPSKILRNLPKMAFHLSFIMHLSSAQYAINHHLTEK